ncbi:MAG: tetratricopeptide repeat protein [Spartobacteria bacterium]|nr:tetratricopeptide repeat protein [Spartobacteria bacterium]
MQQNPGDIYHEDVTPDLVKRSRRYTSERRKRSSRQRNDTKKKTPPPIKSTARSSRRRRSSTGMRSSVGTLLLWGVIGLVLAAYLAFLGHAYLQRKAKVQKATGAVTGPVDAVADASEATPVPDAFINVAMITDLSQQEQRVRQEVDLSLTMLSDDSPAKALARLIALYENFPDDLEVKITLARAYIAQKNYPEAVLLLYDTLKATPGNQEARIMLADILLEQNQYQEALAITTWVLDTNPYSIPANSIAADAYLAMDKPSWSIPFLRRIIAQDRENFSALNRIAKAYADMGEYQKAVLEFTRMMDMNVADSVTYCNLAICYAQQMKADKAVIILDQAANMYGYSFVRSWLEQKEFDPIRDTPPFKTFAARQKLAQKKAPPAAPETDQ